MEPCLIIASPQMRDPFFERTVVLVWHNDQDGAVGVVVNRPLEHTLAEVLQMTDIPSDAENTARVAWGGPVQSTSGTVVTRGAIAENEGWKVSDGVAVTQSEDVLRRLLESGDDLLLCLGYAGWGPGQLDRELQEGSWLWTEADPKLIFEAAAEDRWEAALATLGLTQHTVWMTPIQE